MAWEIDLRILESSVRDEVRDPELLLEGELVEIQLRNTAPTQTERARDPRNWARLPRMWVQGSRLVGPVPPDRTNPLRYRFRFNHQGRKMIRFEGEPLRETARSGAETATRNPDSHRTGALLFDAVEFTEFSVDVVAEDSPYGRSEGRSADQRSRRRMPPNLERSQQDHRRLRRAAEEERREVIQREREEQARAAHYADIATRLYDQRMAERPSELSTRGVIGFRFRDAGWLEHRDRQDFELAEYYMRLQAAIDRIDPVDFRPGRIRSRNPLARQQIHYRWIARHRGRRVEVFRQLTNVTRAEAEAEERRSTLRYSASDTLRVRVLDAEHPVVITAGDLANTLIIDEVLRMVDAIDLGTTILAPLGTVLGRGLSSLARIIRRPSIRQLVMRPTQRQAAGQVARRSSRGTSRRVQRRFQRARDHRSHAEREIARSQRAQRRRAEEAALEQQRIQARADRLGVSTEAAALRTRAHRDAVRAAIRRRRQREAVHLQRTGQQGHLVTPRREFREFALDQIAEHPDHPLLILIDPSTGDFVRPAGRTWALRQGSESPEVGHLLARSLHSGGEDTERLALQWGYSNQVQSIAERRAASAPARYRADLIDAVTRRARDVQGVPVEEDYLELLERWGLVPQGTLERSPVSQGWQMRDWATRQVAPGRYRWMRARP